MATSFVCLVLAFQVMSQNLHSMKLKKENEMLVKERDDLMECMEGVRSEEFLKGVVDRCLGVERKVSTWNWFGKNERNLMEEEIMLRSILHDEIKKATTKEIEDDGTALITNMLESLSEDVQDDSVGDIIESEDGKIQRTTKFSM